MGSLGPIMTVIDRWQVSPPPTATVGDASLAMTYMDILQLTQPPLHYLFFYQLPAAALTKTHFLETIVPNLEHSLSITLQHFPPLAGNIIVYPTSTSIKPHIRYVKGDSVKVTVAECNLDFDYLAGYQPRNCDQFYHLIPLLGDTAKISDYMKIPVFSVQVTLFPNCGISIGMTFHHSVVDASTVFCFLNAWTSIAQCGTDESFLADGTNLPFYRRVISYPEERDDLFLRLANAETLFGEEYQPPKLSGPTDKIRVTFVLPRTIIDQLKKRVSAQLPTLSYVSSFTVTCAYIWCCLAKAYNEDERQVFLIPVDARRRLDPPIPATYFGNCICGNLTIARTKLLKGNDGFIAAAKLIGENLHNMLNDKDGILKFPEVPIEGMPKKMIGISGSPRLRYYDIMDFGWGKPKKLEKISIDYGSAISIDASKENNQDMEIGVSLTPTQMEAFVTAFNQELQP